MLLKMGISADKGAEHVRVISRLLGDRRCMSLVRGSSQMINHGRDGENTDEPN
jgi:hypothetical protein